MSFTRFHDDPCRIQKQLQETTDVGKYILDVPSNIGNSFDESSIFILSISKAYKTERRCSTVIIDTLSFERLVPRKVLTTLSISADIIVLLIKNCIPKSIGAGYKINLQLIPVCNPTPSKLILLFIVF